MLQSDFRLPALDGTAIFVRTFLPDRPPRGIVQVVHGMCEHGARYARFAEALVARGYGVYASDHRGHGQTAGSREALGHFADHEGWSKVVSDQVSLVLEIESRHPQRPLFLFGHSMGSYVARSAALRIGSSLSGLLLCGTSHDSPLFMRAARLLALEERARLGPRAVSPLLNRLTFGTFNATIDDPRTSHDWLSRDNFEVDKYIADPLCGFGCSTQLFCDLFEGMGEVFTAARLSELPKDLPIYILAGEADPINKRLAAIKRLHSALERAGLVHVTLRVYQSARHELLNELNRDEVTRDLLQWLDEYTAQN